MRRGLTGRGEGLPEGAVGVGEAAGAEIGVLTQAALQVSLELGEGHGGAGLGDTPRATPTQRPPTPNHLPAGSPKADTP